LACNGGTPISVQLNGSTFCNTTVYTSNYFTGLATTNYWLSYDGNYRQIFHSGSQNTASQGGSCQTCDNTVPTPTPTSTPVPPTATPTSTPIPPTPTSTDVPPDPTATPEPVTSYQYQLGPSYTQSINACDNASMDFYTEVYAATAAPGNVIQFFTDINLTNGYVGESEFHAYYRSEGGAPASLPFVGRVSGTGLVSDISFCS
jgi:hypothetical protein